MPVAAAVPKNEPTTTAEGLMLAGAVLAKADRDRHGMPALIIDGDEERILAVLALAYDRAIGPAVLANIRRASDNWGRGEPVLAAIDLALGGLSCLDDADAASIRVSLGDKLLGDGLSPRDLLKGCGLDPAPLDLLKAGFNVLEPRIPAGNGRGSGDWTTGGTGLGQPEGSPASPVTLILITPTFTRCRPMPRQSSPRTEPRFRTKTRRQNV